MGLLADSRVRLGLGTAATLITALSARRNRVGYCEGQAFRAIYGLPDSLYGPVWVIMQLGTGGHTRTVEHKHLVRAWLNDLARRAHAAEPGQLARQLTLLLDGGLAAGVLDADPATPAAAKAAARVLADACCPRARSQRPVVHATSKAVRSGQLPLFAGPRR